MNNNQKCHDIKHWSQRRPPMRYHARQYTLNGIRVCPAHSFLDGHCSCPRGEECEDPGRHLNISLVPGGVDNASSICNRVAEWWAADPNANIAILTGPINELYAIHVDEFRGGYSGLMSLENEIVEMPEDTPTIKVGIGGNIFIFSHPGPQPLPCVKDIRPGVDFIGEGGFFIAPPSLNLNGVEDSWYDNLVLHPKVVVPLPEKLIRLIQDKGNRPRTRCVESPLENVLRLLNKVRRDGAGWMALCPSHDDHTPSLSIGLGEGDRVLLHCFAGCPVESILDALGLKMRDLYPLWSR